MKIIDRFDREDGVENTGEIYTTSDGKRIPIYEIESFHRLTQMVGYAKYINKDVGDVYLRGQCKLHDCKLSPSLYRGIKRCDAKLMRSKSFWKETIRASKMFDRIGDDILYPLLQHYGVKTYWLDIVDNLWVSIWFSVHEFKKITVGNSEHVHIVRRNGSGYAYIILLVSDAVNESEPGIYTGVNTTITDLRKACASTYLRPHAQHALMLRKSDIKSSDYTDLVVGVAKIPVERAVDWIGGDGLMSIQSLFPPTYYDYGYRDLLAKMNVCSDKAQIDAFGSINTISY